MREDPRLEQKSSKINLYLDKELDQDQEQKFLKDIQEDDELSRNLVKEQKIRGLLKKNIASPGVPQSLKDRIKKSFRG